MAIIFDGSNLTVTLDSGITEVDIVDDVYSAWKEWMLTSSLNRRYPPAFRSDGGNPLSSIINQGSYIFLNNIGGWRIKPPEEDITVYLTGNLAVEDTSLPAFIPTTGTYTAAILGLQPVTQGVTPIMANQLAYASFSGASGPSVTVDVINGTALNGADPLSVLLGNSEFPVNNIPDAVLINDARGLPDTMDIIGNITLDTGDNVTNFLFVGQNTTRSNITINSPSITDGCEFRHAFISGVLDGDNILRECVVGSILYFSGYVYECALVGTMTLGGGVNAYLYDCKDGVIGVDGPHIDMGGSGQAVVVSGYGGDLHIHNKSGSDDISIGLRDGRVVFGPTVTNGTAIVSGTGRLVDQSTGSAIVIPELVSGAEIATLGKLVESLRPHHTGWGNVWYWDPVNGNDTNDGDHVSRATKTFAQAHTLVKDNNHDIIFCIPGNPNGVTVTTENLVITKNYVFVRGPGRDFSIQSTDDNLDAIYISGDGVEISSVDIDTSVTSNKHAIFSNGNFTFLDKLWLHDTVECIHIEDSNNTVLRDVKAHHNLAYGLKIVGDCDHIDLIDCHFGSNYLDNVIIDISPGHEINFLGSTVIHNSTTGYGVNISAQSKGVIFADGVEVFDNFAGNINDLSTNTHYSYSYDMWQRSHHLTYTIYIDTGAATNGHGSQAEPFNDLTDAIDHAEEGGITGLVVLDDITLDRSLKNFVITGVGNPTVDCNGQDLTHSEFFHCKMEGTYIGEITVQESVLLDGFYLNGYFEKCALAGDLFCIDGADIFILGCASKIPGLDRPTISMNGAGWSHLSVRKNTGGMTIKDCNNSLDKVTVEVSEGALTFDASCTDGVMVARGVCEFENETGRDEATGVHDQVLRPSQVKEIWKTKGLDPNDPYTNTPSKFSTASNDIDIDVTGDPNTSITLTRS
ncbi:MAG: hypothetical protein KAS32_23105 [Candidatus Peribacteraceae bacterium]|nr:hypothetical protein [Candidatus Peribacteraceae bacterium]